VKRPWVIWTLQKRFPVDAIGECNIPTPVTLKGCFDQVIDIIRRLVRLPHALTLEAMEHASVNASPSVACGFAVKNSRSNDVFPAFLLSSTVCTFLKWFGEQCLTATSQASPH